MKRMLLFVSMMMAATLSMAQGGMPFIRNYTTAEYKAHNRNMDVVTGSDGTVYVANFEGLLYYDKAEWRILHTPDITRITDVYRDSEGTIWVGGYNYLGVLRRCPNGSLDFSEDQQYVLRGEVTNIWEENRQMYFLLGDTVYAIKDKHVVQQKDKRPPTVKAPIDDVLVTQVEPLPNGMQAVSTNGSGVIILNAAGKELYRITAQNGLCSNSVAHISYDGHGILWGATDNGVFAVSVVSAFTQFSAHEGLDGEVLTIQKFNGRVFVGTLDGLFYRKGLEFVRVNGIEYACWMLKSSGDVLLAATSNGIYSVSYDGQSTQLTKASATSLYIDGDIFYSGELDGVYENDWKGNRTKVSDLEKVTMICMDSNRTLWLKTIFGHVFTRKHGQNNFVLEDVSGGSKNSATIVEMNGKVIVLSTADMKPFPYPQFSYTDPQGVTWLTNNEGEQIYAWKDGRKLEEESLFLSPIAGETVNAMLIEGKQQWFGGDFGIVIVDKTVADPLMAIQPQLLIRSMVLNGDSVLWGGYGECPALISLESNEKNLNFTFSISHEPLIGTTLYRYRINKGEWSAWSPDRGATFFNHHSGVSRLEVQACDAFGRVTETVGINFTIKQPFYFRWYMYVLYLLLFSLVVYLLVRLRLHRLNQEKIRLESIVQERTSEVVRQKNEIEEKSNSLEKALSELNEAQGELIRQEKMATVGKLTKGLIDRILNPLNYINNFSKLSEGLIRDIEANIEDDKDNMDPDNYEDTVDVLGMLRSNLQKVSEHGQNTTRTLKAMEEMLKDRSGGIVPMNLTPVLHQDEEMLRNYFAGDIAKYGVQIAFEYPEEISMNGNPELLSMTLMSMLGNAFYAVVKRRQRDDFQAEVSLKANIEGDKVVISIRDNGIGIEDTIIDKIFDPFFTTKTTGEAAGVGLYLSREIIQNHGGDIYVKSEKNVYSEFTIILPTLKT